MPLSPCEVALGAGGTFIARSIDTEAKHLSATVKCSHAHRGAAFVEILQNCPIYNDGIFDQVKDKKIAADFRVEVEHGKPLLFGKDKEKAIVLNRESLNLEVVAAAGNEDKILVHDERNRVLAQLLPQWEEGFPIAVGVLFSDSKSTFTEDTSAHLESVRKTGARSRICCTVATPGLSNDAFRALWRFCHRNGCYLHSLTAEPGFPRGPLCLL